MAFNILIVDDSRTVRSFVQKALKLAGVPTNEVFQASNGKEALQVVSDNWVDCILADLNMPVMSGFEMIDKLQEDGLMKTVPVVVMSTEGNKERIASLESKGVRAYLRKPFRPEKFRAVLADILGESNE